MVIVIGQLSDMGVNHPVSRLSSGFIELLNWANFTQEEKDKVFRILLTKLTPILGECWDIVDNLVKEAEERTSETKKKNMESFSPTNKNSGYYLAGIPTLETRCGNFLNLSTRFLKELFNAAVVFHPKLKDACGETQFNPNSKNNIFEKWPEVVDEETYKNLLESDKEWIKELFSKRNAVEHPKGKSGELVIDNFKFIGELRPLAPTWVRIKNGNQLCDKTDLLNNLLVLRQNLLTFAEELLIYGCIDKRKTFNSITFVRIPEDSNNPSVIYKPTIIDFNKK